MDQNSSSSAQTGTRDSTYDIVAVLYHALQGAENCQTYLGDASSEPQLRQFFEQALQAQRQLADQAKMLLHEQLMNREGGGQSGGMSGASGGSAFSQFGSAGSGGSQSSSMGGQSSMSDDDQQRAGSYNDREGGGSALTSGTATGAQQNDPSMGQFGQSPMGGGQRHNEMSTGGGGTSSF